MAAPKPCIRCHRSSVEHGASNVADLTLRLTEAIGRGDTAARTVLLAQMPCIRYTRPPSRLAHALSLALARLTR